MSALEGRTIRLEVLGCRTNQYEGDALAFALSEAGARVVDAPPYDAVVLVSCTITAVADRKGRALLRRFRRECPGAVVVLCGCQAQAMPLEEARSLGVDVLVGNRRKALLPELLARRLASPARAGEMETCRGDVRQAPWDPLEMGRPVLHTRAFLKIQDGCDHGCAYCIVPSVRGGPVSRPPDEVLAEVRRIVASGCVEVVLTGVHMGLYGRGVPYSLGELVRRLGKMEGLRRIRFGSLEPFALSVELLEELRSVRTFCPHLHIPLQSGDDEVLRRMRRGYSASRFARQVDALRRTFGDDVHVSTDLLVGFPGENEEAFRRTLALVTQLQLGRLHVFPYSPRPGTAAAAWPDRPSREEARERCREGEALGKALLSRYAARFVGREVEVLVEEGKNGTFQGLSPHFLRVRYEGVDGAEKPGTLVTVKIRSEDRGVLRGGDRS